MIGIFTASTFVFGTEEYTYCMAKWNKYLALSVQLFFFLHKSYFLLIAAFVLNADTGS